MAEQKMQQLARNGFNDLAEGIYVLQRVSDIGIFFCAQKSPFIAVLQYFFL